jgi:hypothetical protein
LTAVPVILVPTNTEGVPKLGDTKVGLVENTSDPVPVSFVRAAIKLALVGAAKNAAIPAANPEIPVETGKPVQLVNTPEVGVPSTGVVNVLLVNVAGEALSAITNAVFASCSVFVPAGAVGAVGTRVKAGLIKSAFTDKDFAVTRPSTIAPLSNVAGAALSNPRTTVSVFPVQDVTLTTSCPDSFNPTLLNKVRSIKLSPVIAGKPAVDTTEILVEDGPTVEAIVVTKLFTYSCVIILPSI